MSYQIRPAVTSEAKPLIGLYSESGGGKTYTSLLLALGFTGDMKKVCMIETESGRGEVYADDAVVGGYDVLSLRDNFSPTSYGAAIEQANKAGYRALIIDSASHEWESATGVLGMAADNEAAGKKGMIVWQKPKMDHQREFMLKLMQTPIPLVIVCMRAKYPMKQVFKDGKKELQRSETLEPKQSDDILFELMVHGYLDQQHNFHVTKYTKDTFRQIFIDGKPIDRSTGERLAVWAIGARPADHTEKLRSALKEANIPESEFLKAGNRASLSEVSDIGKALLWISKNNRATPHSVATNAELTHVQSENVTDDSKQIDNITKDSEN
ncbi:MAG: AAA family ATPase [Pseudomonadota bacterium]